MADIQYLNYGDLQIELLALLTLLASLVQNYVLKLPWSNSKKEKFMSAYTDIINRGINGVSNLSGQWEISVGGSPLLYLSLKDKEMYQEAAYFILQQMATLPTKKSEEEKKSNLPIFDFNSGFIDHVNKSINGGKPLVIGGESDLWNWLDERGADGIRGTEKRTAKLAELLESYKKELGDNPQYNFEGSPYKDLNDFHTKIDAAISALRSPRTEDDRGALLAIGLNSADWFNNGSGDPSGKYIQLSDGSQKELTYALLNQYNKDLEKLKEEELKKIAELIKANRFDSVRRYNISGFLGKAMSQESMNNIMSKLNTFLLLDSDELEQLTWAFRNSNVNLENLSREEFVKMPSQYRKAGRLKKISGLDGIYYDTVDGNLVLPYNVDLGGASLLDIIAKNTLENSLEYKIQKADERKLSEGFKTEDYLRMGAIALDITGSLAAFVPGYGTAASGILGLTSLGTNLAADVADESLTKMDVVKNVGLNATLGLVGLVPGLGVGARSTRWLTQIAKWVPRILTGAMATQVALSDDIKNSLKKAGDSSKWGTITNHDMKNIAYALSVVAGTARMGRSAYDSRKFKPAFEGKTELNNYIITKSGKRIKASPEQIEKINKAGRKGGTEKANEELRKLPGAENEEISNEFKTGFFSRSKVETAHETIPVESSHRTLAYARKLRMENEALKRKHPYISKILPTDYDIYSGMSKFLMPKVDIMERLKKSWSPISEGKFREQPTAEQIVSSYRSLILKDPLLKNAVSSPSRKTSRATRVIEFKNNNTSGELVDGSKYNLKYDIDTDKITVEFKGEKIEFPGDGLHEQKIALGKWINKQNNKILQESTTSIKSNDPKWQTFVKSIKDLKRKGYLFKQGGKITDSQIDNFLKQYK